MMARFAIQKVGDTYEISGHMDEHTDFSPLLADADGSGPLKLSFEGVTSMNSVGARALTLCMRELGQRAVELHQVPTFLVEQINVVPGLIGKRAKNVASLFAPYHCSGCKLTTDSLVERHEVHLSHRGTEAPVRRCERCGAAMKLRGEEEDLFLFLTYSA